MLFNADERALIKATDVELQIKARTNQGYEEGVKEMALNMIQKRYSFDEMQI